MKIGGEEAAVVAVVGDTKLTNRLGLPSTIVRAVVSDPYVGGGDISVTKLISPPWQARLRREHGEVSDVADRIWALIGQLGHSILERVETAEDSSVREQRLFREFDVPGIGKKTLSGQFDLIENNVLTDFKFTTVWSADGKEDWEQQLNCLAFLSNDKAMSGRDSRYAVHGAQIVAVFRDWSKAKAKVTADYPKQQVGIIPVKLWSVDEQYRFIIERLKLHFAADPAPCSDEERWKRADVYAAMKGDRKTSTKNFDNQAEADAWVATQKDAKAFRIVHRPGTFVRCESYCAVSTHCPLWNAVPF